MQSIIRRRRPASPGSIRGETFRVSSCGDLGRSGSSHHPPEPALFMEMEDHFSMMTSRCSDARLREPGKDKPPPGCRCSVNNGILVVVCSLRSRDPDQEAAFGGMTMWVPRGFCPPELQTGWKPRAKTRKRELPAKNPDQQLLGE